MLNNDYKEILRYFIEEKVDFMLVGAYAMAAYGYPRATGDMDIFVNSDVDNSQRIYNALKKFGAPLFGINPFDFAEEGIVFQIGVVPRRIDIITSIDGVGFQEAAEERIEIEIENMKIPILSLENMIINKMATGREKDRLDAVRLKQILNKHF